MAKLRLVQTFGKPPDVDPNNEKWLVVELKRDFSYFTEKRFYEIAGNGFPYWGSYRIRDNKDSFNPNFGIGMMKSSNQLKIWAYKPGELSLYFATIKTGLSDGAGDKAPNELVIEMILENVVLLNPKVTSLGNSSYNRGQVYMNSYAGPFEKGLIYWETY